MFRGSGVEGHAPAFRGVRAFPVACGAGRVASAGDGRSRSGCRVQPPSPFGAIMSYEVTLYRAVTKARELIAAGAKPANAAEIACEMFGIGQAPRVKRLAVSAIKACEAARQWLLENPQ